MTKSINWPDILVHAAVALPMGAVAGAGLQVGLADGSIAGKLLAVLSAAGGLGAALYWVRRELIQHGGKWGGLQSNLEWAIPVAVTPFGAVAGWWVSGMLL